MKIQIKYLEPNPFRDIANYPIDKERVEKLKGSIQRTQFWGGLVCRPHPSKKNMYQLAFGHHRLQALIELGITEIVIKEVDYSDAQMLQAMADENREIGQHDIKILINTIQQVKYYLDGEFKKYNTWEEFRSAKFSRPIMYTEPQFRSIKGKGVGRDTILIFLGEDWKAGEIEFALSNIEKIDEGRLDREALEQFDNRYQAQEFVKAVVFNKAVPKEKQREIAQKVVKEMKENKHGGRHIKSYVQEALNPKRGKADAFREAEIIIENITKTSKQLLKSVMKLKSYLKKMKVEELKGLKVFEAQEALQELISGLKGLNQKGKKNEVTKSKI